MGTQHTRQICAPALLVVFAAFIAAITPASAYPLTRDQEERLRKFIPRTFDKLSRRESVHIIGLGDSVTEFYAHSDQSYDALRAYYGRFAHRLEREFFYTGGVRVVNPKGGTPEKHHDHRGPELTIQSMARGGRVALHALQRLTTDAFLYEPDLIIINYGINDALTQFPLEGYRKALEESVGLCKSKGVEVILMGCSAVLRSSGPTGIGMTRPYVSAARDVAREHGVLFADLGKAMVAGPGSEPGIEARLAIQKAVANVKAHFDHGPGVEDSLHPRESTHAMLGDALFDVLLNGEPVEEYALAGTCRQRGEGKFLVEFELLNRGSQPRIGYLCALNCGGWLAADNPYREFEIPAGESRKFEVEYALRESPDYPAQSAFERLPADATALPVPVLISDAEKTQLLELRAEKRPVAMVWKTGLQDEVRGIFSVGCTLVNTDESAVKGSYQVTWREQKIDGEFSLDAGQSKAMEFTFTLPSKDSVFRLRNSLNAALSIAGAQYLYKREIEATRNLSLKDKVSMARFDRYRPNAGAEEYTSTGERVAFQALADEKALYLLFDLPKGMRLIEGPEGGVAAIAEITIDARPAKQRRKFGFVERIKVEWGAVDGRGTVKGIKEANFGDGYDRLLDPAGITAELTTTPEGRRRFSVVIPRQYFYLHEWRLENPNSMLGLAAKIGFLAPGVGDRPPAFATGTRYVLSENRLGAVDPRSLTALELSNIGTDRWSVRLY